MSDVRCSLNEAAYISGSRQAVVGDGAYLRYSELEQCVEATAGLLRQTGCQNGARAAILLPPDWRSLVLILALIRAEAVACPIDTPDLVAQTKTILKQTGCSFVIAPSELATSGVAQKKLPDNIQVLNADKLVGYTGLMKKGHVVHIPIDRPATISLNTTTSDELKALFHSFGNHYYSARGANNAVRISSEDCWMLTMPLSRTTGMETVFRCLLSGATLAMPSPAESLADAIRKYEASWLTLDPPQVENLLNDKNAEPYEKLRGILVTGGEFSNELLNRAAARGITLYATYDIQEMSGHIATASLTDTSEQRCCAGHPLRHRELDTDDRGKILVRGNTLCLGALRDGELVPLVIEEDGWFQTTVDGTLSADGVLRFRTNI